MDADHNPAKNPLSWAYAEATSAGREIIDCASKTRWCSACSRSAGMRQPVIDHMKRRRWQVEKTVPGVVLFWSLRGRRSRATRFIWALPARQEGAFETMGRSQARGMDRHLPARPLR